MEVEDRVALRIHVVATRRGAEPRGRLQIVAHAVPEGLPVEGARRLGALVVETVARLPRRPIDTPPRPPEARHA